MKFAIAICCLAVFVAVANAQCDPNGQGVPNCVGAKNGGAYRDNWDPTHFFECQDGKAVSVACTPVGKETTGFFDAKGGCVPWSQWTWTPPCPESE